jgi:hypothetical protein
MSTAILRRSKVLASTISGQPGWIEDEAGYINRMAG